VRTTADRAFGLLVLLALGSSALLIALRMKGETAGEITGAAQAMRERVTPLDVDRGNLIDTCGTGGDGAGGRGHGGRFRGTGHAC